MKTFHRLRKDLDFSILQAKDIYSDSGEMAFCLDRITFFIKTDLNHESIPVIFAAL